MIKMKRVLAAVLATTLTVGTSLSAFAAETSGGSNGAGTSEGHVNKHIVSVTLPVIPQGSTPFAYTVDPERLVTETNAARYAGETFTDDAKAKGVYFKTGASEYDYKSKELKALSQSSVDVNLIVEVETVAAGATDIPLVDAAPALTEEGDPALYLALKVDDTTKALKSGEKVKIETTIAGVDSNFETVYDDTESKYVYKPRTGDLTWNEATIQMSGVVSKSSAEGITAPTVKVTWKWEDPEANAAPSITLASVTAAENTDAVWTYSLGNGDDAATAISKITYNGADATSAFDLTTAGQIKLAQSTVNSLLGSAGSYTYTVLFNDAANTTGTFTLVVE
jgi:uncharacterized Zn ribbon protein